MSMRFLGRSKQVVLLASTAMAVIPVMGGVAAAQATAATAAPAAAASTSSAPIGEVIVTAQHRAENVQKVPISITALSGVALDKEGATGFEDYLRQVPGVSFVPLGPGLGQLNIRGVETQPIARDQPGVKPSVGVYLDETPIAIGVFNPDLDVYDMQRVEVLRGPQGTLFGSGSLSGTIRFITNKPDPEHYEGSIELGGGGIQGGSPSYDAKGMVNIPLTDTAALRIVAYENHYGGWIDQVQALYDGQEYGIAKKNVNDAEKYGVRTEFGFQTGDIKGTLSYTHQTITANGYPLADITNPNFPATNYSAGPYPVAVTTGPEQQFREEPESRSDTFNSFSATFNYNLKFADLVSVSSYTTRQLFDSRDYTTDDDSYGADFAAPSSLVDTHSITDYSQEFRLVSNMPGPFSWSTGVFYSDLTHKYEQVIDEPGSDAVLGSSLALGTSQANQPYDGIIATNLKEYAIYGEGKYQLTDKLSVTAGIRGFKYNEVEDSAYRGVFGSDGGVSKERNSNATGYSPRGILAYQATPDLLFSAQVSRGFRPGSSNDILPPICNATAPSQYGPETLTNYELAAKSRWLGGMLTVNGALYQIDYQDLQLNARLACSFSFITNGGSAQTRGLELETVLHPIQNLTISLNGTLQDPKLTSNLPAVAAVVLPGVSDGARLPGSPKHTENLSVDYGLPDLYREYEGYVSANIQNVGGIKTYIQDPDDLDTKSYTLGGLRFGLRNARYDIGAYIDNIGNTVAQLSLEREVSGRFSFVRNEPRSFGVNLKAKF